MCLFFGFNLYYKLFLNPFQDEIAIVENKSNIEIEYFDVFGRIIPLVRNGNAIDTNVQVSGIIALKYRLSF
ncbi:hypothetical protein [Lacinutrix jangbogonensis]|uniref:hypothetical protein n=1 Tax=Lacinutrix jangbogonensis TaxID=1469557 RepID=UPI00053EEA6E|nr:hypothetical protein [Lacinutrix jangbogonensis]